MDRPSQLSYATGLVETSLVLLLYDQYVLLVPRRGQASCLLPSLMPRIHPLQYGSAYLTA